MLWHLCVLLTLLRIELVEEETLDSVEKFTQIDELNAFVFGFTIAQIIVLSLIDRRLTDYKTFDLSSLCFQNLLGLLLNIFENLLVQINFALLSCEHVSSLFNCNMTFLSFLSFVVDINESKLLCVADDLEELPNDELDFVISIVWNYDILVLKRADERNELAAW
jgi:hypothetical protein